MPFGLADAPAYFQRFIQSILSEFFGVCLICVHWWCFFLTEEEHSWYIDLVLDHLQAHELVAAPKKCSFYQEKMIFWGFLISMPGLFMDPAKLETITSFPYTVNTKHLDCFF